MVNVLFSFSRFLFGWSFRVAESLGSVHPCSRNDYPAVKDIYYLLWSDVSHEGDDDAKLQGCVR